VWCYSVEAAFSFRLGLVEKEIVGVSRVNVCFPHTLFGGCRCDFVLVARFRGCCPRL